MREQEIYSLHRRLTSASVLVMKGSVTLSSPTSCRLNGCFQLASRVGARIRAREILLEIERDHEAAEQAAELAAEEQATA